MDFLRLLHFSSCSVATASCSRVSNCVDSSVYSAPERNGTIILSSNISSKCHWKAESAASMPCWIILESFRQLDKIYKKRLAAWSDWRREVKGPSCDSLQLRSWFLGTHCSHHKLRTLGVSTKGWIPSSMRGVGQTSRRFKEFSLRYYTQK